MTQLPAGWESLLNRMQNRQGADATTPAFSYPVFLNETTKLFVEKSTDYDDRFIKGMIDLDARTLWAWEVDKKLDRLRTWLKRGELQVQGEGIRNSVDDLFIYTVQYVAYIQNVVNNQKDPGLFLSVLREDRRYFFEYNSKRLKASEWVWFLVNKGRIGEDEIILQFLLRSYMGEELAVDDWRTAIRQTLERK